MNITEKCKAIIAKPFFQSYNTVFGLWMLMAVIAWLTKYFPGKYNNYLIFRQTFWHATDHLSLYAQYPAEYFDSNHYGPLFALFMAPFSVLPVGAGLFLWLVSLALFLYIATRKLDFTKRKLLFVYWFCFHELLTALFMSQFNIAIAAIIILTFVCIEKEKDFWAAFLIVAGTLIKLYGIVGLAFFFFSRHKLKFILSCIGWSIFLFVLPMFFFGDRYIISEYVGWYFSLLDKNGDNMFSLYQNVSFLGMIRKISGCASYSDLYLIVSGLIVLALPYLRIGQYKHEAFRQTLLASILMFVVLFSTGSESSTYIIPFMGVAIWYVASPWKRSKIDIALMVFAFVLTSLSPSDLFPRSIRKEWIQPYALKALPCMIIWLKLSYEMCTRSYAPIKEKEETP